MHADKLLLGLWLALSAALHLALIFWLPVVGAQNLASIKAGAPLQVRLVPAQHERAVLIEAEADAVATHEVDRIAQAGSGESSDTQPSAAVPGGASEASLTLPYAPPRDSEYLGRAQLTVPPAVVGEVEIPDPGPAALAATGAAPTRVILTLYINEFGLVDKITFDSPDVPAALEKAARLAFQTARFAPGHLDGAPVKSRMRIEVGFEPLISKP